MVSRAVFCLSGCLPVGPRSSINLLVGRLVPDMALLSGPGCPKVIVGVLVIGAGSLDGWLRSSRCLRAGVSLPVGGARSWVLWL